MIVLLGFAGWAVDFAHWNDERTNMQKAADAAALAGAVYLPDDPAGAIAAAKSIAAKNGYSSGVSVTTLANANQLKVTINTNVKSSFAQVVGIGSADLSKHATSEYESPQPLDFVLILDRTGSMQTPMTAARRRSTSVKDATLAVLGYLNPKNESIALGTARPSDDEPDVHRRERRRLRRQYSTSDVGGRRHHLDGRAVPATRSRRTTTRSPTAR